MANSAAEIRATEITPASWFTGLIGVFQGDSIGIMRKDNSATEVLPIPFRRIRDIHPESLHNLQPGEWVILFNVHDRPSAPTPLPQVK
jgi:hypothetical protein